MASKEEISNIFPEMMNTFRPDKAQGITAMIQFDLSGDNGGLFWVKVDNGEVSHGEGSVEANLTVKAVADDFHEIAGGKMNPMQAFMMGKIKVDDMGLGTKMIAMFQLA